jgi:hypothetical protein
VIGPASALLEALASYHAQVGELGTAEDYWIKVASLDEPFARNGMTGLVKLAAVRGLFYVAAGLLQIQKFRKNGTDGLAITLPHNRDGRLDQAERQLKRSQEALEKIVPSDELWRFGGDSD